MPDINSDDVQNSFKKSFIAIARRLFKSNPPLDEAKKTELRNELVKLTSQNFYNLLIDGRVMQDSEEFLANLLEQLIPENNRALVQTTQKTYDDGIIKYSEEDPSRLPKAAVIFSNITEDNLSFSKILGHAQEPEPMNQQLEGRILTSKAEKFSLRRSDQEIVFSLNRFTSDRSGNSEKINKTVSFDPIKLEGMDLNYEPTAFIVHIGETLSTGHYITYVKEKEVDGTTGWYCYNDSKDRQKVTDLKKEETSKLEIPTEAQNAYVVKYSPVADDKITDKAARYTTGLPSSQHTGLTNQGTIGKNQCWANAAFTFALSMTSLYSAELELPNADPDTPPPPPANPPKPTNVLPPPPPPATPKPAAASQTSGPEITLDKEDPKKFFSNKEVYREITAAEITVIKSTNAVSHEPLATTTNNSISANSFKESITTSITDAKGSLDNKEIGIIMLIAIKNGGIGNEPSKLLEKLKSLQTAGIIESGKNLEELQKSAIKFSRDFQDNLKKQQIFTGNKDATSLEGMRLKRLTPDWAKSFFSDSKDYEKTLADLKLGTPSTNPTPPISAAKSKKVSFSPETKQNDGTNR